MSYPILYAKNTTSFFNLGLGVLSETTKCVVTEERNGVFELLMEYPISGTLFNVIENDLILKCDAGHALKNQLFRIKKITKTNDKTAEIYAQHVSYLSQDLTLRPEVTFRGSASNALMEWRGSIIDANPFTTDSDILTDTVTTLTIKTCENARRALGGVSGSILDRWGGEYRFDNYHISLLSARGGNANTLIAYGRNLTDLQQEDNIESTYTSLMPFAVYTPENEDERIVTVDGYIVDSEHLDKYPNRRIMSVDLSEKFGDDEVPTPTRLKTFAEQYIKSNDIGVPKVSLKISFVDLTKSLNFTGSNYEELNLCDTVPIYFEKLDIKTRAKIVKIEWNVLMDRYDNLELGDTRPNLSDKLNQITSDINATNRNLTDGLNYALISANGRNTVFYGTNQPIANRVGDLWYKPNGDDTELYIWDGAVWSFIMSTAPDQALLDSIEQAQKEAEGALNRANNAYDNAETARKEVQQAFDDVAQLTIDVDDLHTDLTSVSVIAQGLQTQVTSIDNSLIQTQTQVTQLSNQFNIVVQDLSDLDNIVSSNYTQLSDSINLRVSKNEVINQINISTEGITINGNRIHITGQTFIDNAVITSAMIASINAGKITTGTLNAANVSIINLDVNNLTGDKTNFVQSHWNSVTSQLQIRSDGMGLYSDGIMRSTLDSTGITLYHPNGSKAGAFEWIHQVEPPVTSVVGARLIVDSDGFLGIGTTNQWDEWYPIGVSIEIDGKTNTMDVHGMRLGSNIRTHGFYGFEDVFIAREGMKSNSLATFEYSVNEYVIFETLIFDGSVSAFVFAKGNCGLAFLSDGRLKYKTNGGWHDF